MTSVLRLHLELIRLSAGKLCCSALFCIEVIETWLTREHFAVFCELQSLYY